MTRSDDDIERLAHAMHREDCERGGACEHESDPWYRQLARIALDFIDADQHMPDGWTPEEPK